MTDLTYSLRTLTRTPRYTVLAILTLTAGIGVPAAMFGLLDALYFRPLPIVEPERLADVTMQSPTNRFGSFSYEEFRDIERTPVFQDVFAIGRRGVTLNHQGEAHLLLIHYVSARYFPSLGIPMHLGRGFAASDDSPAATMPQAVINHQVWKDRLGAPPDIIGRTIQLNSTMFTVIGVTAPGFVGLNAPGRTDVWVTVAQAPFVVPGLRDEIANRRQRWFQIVGRLGDGMDAAQAGAALEVVSARWRALDARDYADTRILVRLQQDQRDEAAQQGAIFLGIVALVLLIACANVANLTLARGEGRGREIALRSALGATRAGLLRQMVVESAVVSVTAAAAGLLLAAWLIQIFPALLPPSSFVVLDVRVDARLVAFTVALTAAAATLVGLLPAWQGSRVDITSALKGQGAGGRRRGLSARDLLVAGEIALAGVVTIAAGLLVRDLATSLAMDPGFETGKRVATFYVVPGLKGYDRPATYRFLEAARLGAATVPGVTRASYGIRLPAQGNEAGWSAAFTIPGKEPPSGKDAFQIRYTMVGPGYFEVMGTRILSGRGIVETDRPESAPVAVISDTMARRLWPGESPLGRHIRMGRANPVEREIVGVAEDIRIGGLYEPPEMYVYVPYAQDPQGFGLLLVESATDMSAVIGPVKQRVADVDANVPVLAVGSFAEHMRLLLYEDRRNAWIGLGVALLALTLGAVGVYGVVALVTARRTKELGIRVALGAERRQLLRLLLGHGAKLALAGAALGVAGGVAAGRLLQDQLRVDTPTDPWTVAWAVVILMAVALGASFTPAWRASRIDPIAALREE
jgi:predicted permease